jgi:hypothetical protein
MKLLQLLFLAGLLAAFIPRYPKEGASKELKKERRVYLLLSAAGFGLGVMHQIGWFPAIAKWLDNAMDLVNRNMGGGSI